MMLIREVERKPFTWLSIGHYDLASGSCSYEVSCGFIMVDFDDGAVVSEIQGSGLQGRVDGPIVKAIKVACVNHKNTSEGFGLADCVM